MLDVIVIGGGQAGLAAAYYLKQKSVDFLILDGHRRLVILGEIAMILFICLRQECIIVYQVFPFKVILKVYHIKMRLPII